MPILATGSPEKRRSDSGFSLVEALVALALIGLMAGAVLLLGPRGEKASEAFATRFAARLAAAADESVMVNRTIALTASAEGYGFSRLEDGGWALIQDGRALAFEVWPEGIEVGPEAAAPSALRRAAGDMVHLVRFDPVGAAAPAALVVRDHGVPVWRLTVDGQGRARLEPLS